MTLQPSLLVLLLLLLPWLGCSGGSDDGENSFNISSGGTAEATSGGAGTGGLASGGASFGEDTTSGGGTGGGLPTAFGPPALLSEAGLYEADMVTLAAGVRPFLPQYELWTDGATKRRYIWLPEGSQIDTSDMDYWQFPAGTRLFKEFSRDGVRVETRLLERQHNGAWWRVAYQWRDDQTEADAVPLGVENASGTDHDIPSEEDCGTCHLRMPDKVLGFSALQLAWDNPDPAAWTLARLEEEGLLSQSPPALQIPGDATAQAALGYMHANCGHCHHSRSSVSSRVAISLWLTAGALADVASTPTYLSTVGQAIDLAEGSVPGVPLIIDPGSPETSALLLRMDSRGAEYSMPPLGTEDIDVSGRDAVEAWISSLSH